MHALKSGTTCKASYLIFSYVSIFLHFSKRINLTGYLKRSLYSLSLVVTNVKPKLSIIYPLRQFYQPVQPVVQPGDGVIYREFLPDPRLQDFIYCYWQLKTRDPLTEPFNYRVVADGCMDIFVDLNNPDEHFVMGFCKQYTQFPLDITFNYAGIRFLPTMFPRLFNINAAVLSNRVEALREVAPMTSSFLKQELHDGLVMEQLCVLLDCHFLKLAANSRLNKDNRLYEALQLILGHSGNIPIEKHLNTGISSRQLRRLFTYYIGDSAKTFSKIVRFQHLLQAKLSGKSSGNTNLFLMSDIMTRPIL
jgi:hypothetical protein